MTIGSGGNTDGRDGRDGRLGQGFVRRPQDGEVLDLPGWSMTMNVGPSDTGGALTVIHGLMQPGHVGPAPHVHEGHDETFVVLRGRLRFRVGNEFVTAGAGDTVFAGRRLAHGFGNPYGEPAGYVVMLSPSGYEEYFRAVREYLLTHGALPSPELTADLMARYRTTLAPARSDPA